jgi:AcrR family transcriptional regulator
MASKRQTRSAYEAVARVVPRQQRAIRTRNRLFAAAQAEFSARGFHGGRVDRIAAAAGVNKQRLYALFGSKADLFEEVLRSALSEIEAEERRLNSLADSDAPRLAETILNHYLAFHDRHPHFWRLLAWENLEGGRHSAGLTGMRQTTLKRLKTLYGKGQQRGLYPARTSFPYFLFALTALSYFAYSNQATLRRTLGLDFRTPRGRKALVRNLAALLARRG